MSARDDIPASVRDLAARLRALVILDEVGSDNPLGRDAADMLERLASRPAPHEADRDRAAEEERIREDERTIDELREALRAERAEHDLTLYALNHADFSLVGLPYPNNGFRYCTGLNHSALAAAKRLREKGLVTIEDSGAGPMVAWAEGRGAALRSTTTAEGEKR